MSTCFLFSKSRNAPTIRTKELVWQLANRAAMGDTPVSFSFHSLASTVPVPSLILNAMFVECSSMLSTNPMTTTVCTSALPMWYVPSSNVAPWICFTLTGSIVCLSRVICDETTKRQGKVESKEQHPNNLSRAGRAHSCDGPWHRPSSTPSFAAVP